MELLELLEILYDAARAPVGIVVETNDPEFLRQKLYGARKEHSDLSQLSFVISPLNPRDLWIINKGASDARD